MPITKRRAIPLLIAFVAFIATAIAVSLATPDGNLVVTLAPSLIVGLIAYGLATWWRSR